MEILIATLRIVAFQPYKKCGQPKMNFSANYLQSCHLSESLTVDATNLMVNISTKR